MVNNKHNKLVNIKRNTEYVILNHDINIKVEGGWEKGCLYQCISSWECYARPYIWFKQNNWHVFK